MPRTPLIIPPALNFKQDIFSQGILNFNRSPPPTDISLFGRNPAAGPQLKIYVYFYYPLPPPDFSVQIGSADNACPNLECGEMLKILDRPESVFSEPIKTLILRRGLLASLWNKIVFMPVNIRGNVALKLLIKEAAFLKKKT